LSIGFAIPRSIFGRIDERGNVRCFLTLGPLDNNASIKINDFASEIFLPFLYSFGYVPSFLLYIK
jgi:hypothetical protein